MYDKLTAKAIFINYYHYHCDVYFDKDPNEVDDIESCRFETFLSEGVEEIINPKNFLQHQMMFIERDILEKYGCDSDEVERFDFYHLLVTIFIANSDVDVKSLLNE